jgi:thiol:disulfide interchange protein DsbD
MQTMVKIAAAFLVVVSSFLQPAWAEEPIPPSPIVKTQLLVDAPHVRAGEPVWAAVRFTMPDHWHIYWQNPGDSGIPTRYEWMLPDGLTAGAAEWPAPERLEVSGLVNFGYSHTVLLPVPLTPSRNDVRGDVRVNVSWLACRDVCIPEHAVLQAPLAANPAAAMAIAAVRAQMPSEFQGEASYEASSDSVRLQLQLPPSQPHGWGDVSNLQLFPIADGVTKINQPLTFKTTGPLLEIIAPRGSGDMVDMLNGVVRLTVDGKESAFAFHSKNRFMASSAASAASTTETALEEAAVPVSFILALGLAFLGGLILNIMPCVLPILALKALALAKKAKASRMAAAQQGMAYTAGVVISFLLMATVMLAIKASGTAIGWGFQLQNPLFVAVLALVMLLVAANLLGAFQLPVLFGEKATGVDDRSLRGSLLTGALAVMVATPCTAPFMATAVGATLALPAELTLLVFAALGLGMAAPFLLISLWPAALRALPKPSAWMHRFKQLLSIPMLATALWLLWVLVQLLQMGPMEKTALREPYEASRLAELRAAGTPVLVDATAAWCITCKVNAKVALNPESTQALLRQKNVVTMVADWTMNDPKITKFLAGFGRNGVPLVVYYPPHKEGIVLPQLLTPSIVQNAITSSE